MTERYIFDPSINHFTDTKTDKRYCEYNLDEVVDMLNKYEKENQQLKKDVEYYKTERKALFECMTIKDDLHINLKVESDTVKKNEIKKKV